MNREILSLMNLFLALNYVQSKSKSELSATNSAQLQSFNQQQHKALMTLYLREQNQLEPLNLAELAEALGMKKAATSLLVSELEKRGFLCRSIDEENRRYIRITPSDKCRKLGNTVCKNAHKKIQGLLSILTEEERHYFLQASEKIFNAYKDRIGGEK